jgi:hypothetical protein
VLGDDEPLCMCVLAHVGVFTCVVPHHFKGGPSLTFEASAKGNIVIELVRQNRGGLEETLVRPRGLHDQTRVMLPGGTGGSRQSKQAGCRDSRLSRRQIGSREGEEMNGRGTG